MQCSSALFCFFGNCEFRPLEEILASAPTLPRTNETNGKQILRKNSQLGIPANKPEECYFLELQVHFKSI